MIEIVYVDPGFGNDKIPFAIDRVTGAYYPLYKMAFGNDGEATQVSADNPFPISLHDGDGNPLTSHLNIATGEYILNSHNNHVHHHMVNKYLTQHTVTETTLAVATVMNDYEIEVVSSAGFVINDYIHINTTFVETTHPKIVDITGNILLLDRRLDGVHNIGDPVVKTIIDMALAGQVGTIAAPQEYVMGPPPGEIWHLTRILFSIVHSSAGDLGLFGNIAALTNGLLIRARINGQYGTLTNWKTNADMKTDMHDIDFDTRSGGQGNYGTSGRGTFTETGAIMRLDGDTNDQLEIYIQDDITDLGFFAMKGQGHHETK